MNVALIVIAELLAIVVICHIMKGFFQSLGRGVINVIE